MTTISELGEVLREHTTEGTLYTRLEAGRVRCFACGHACRIPAGRAGICKVRYNDGGTLRVPFGYVAALACDPIEKKPFYHVLPGSNALSFGMLGCDLHCAYCQNWLTSQTLRDPEAVSPIRPIRADQIVRLAAEHEAPVVASTYNEPLITAEWAMAIFRAAQADGRLTAFVSNGNATPEVLDALRPHVDLFKVDLKSFQDRSYRQLGGTLQRVLDTIEGLVARGFWVEIVTLLVPGFNDSEAELRDLTGFLAGVSPDLPWHVSAFHPDYKMTDPEPTPARSLMRACEIGAASGLRYVYAGNLPGRVGRWEHTWCPHCGALLVERLGFRVVGVHLARGACPSCERRVPGLWVRGERLKPPERPAGVGAARTGAPAPPSGGENPPPDRA